MEFKKEVVKKYLAEPCREVDDDGNICAWMLNPKDVDDIAAIIERHVGDMLAEKNKRIKWLEGERELLLYALRDARRRLANYEREECGEFEGA